MLLSLLLSLKVDDPQSLSEFRPISLVGYIYKILAKLLTKRMKKVMDGIIDDRQSVFFGDRFLFQSTLVANEAIEEAKRKKKECLFLKVDYNKAFDLVMSFGEKWNGWIKSCLSTSFILMLVNESSILKFKTQRGLRQGTYYPSFLFNIVADDLCGIMGKAIANVIYSSFLVGKSKIQVNLPQYVNDTFFLVKQHFLMSLLSKNMLRSFELISGLKVNYHKSFFGAIGVEDYELEEFTTIMNYKITKLPFVYLGIPIGANPRKEKTWRPIVDKVTKRLSSGKHRSLFMAEESA